ncbi:hypothetical protein VT06_16640 [Arsukibacterium sp. MJ3]|uniref:hypothetical protein n=1 Tax=Arsukibacterium sp. MJ3 TaxID=1632859 RepID=UPI0006273492|nr:hypothetical protein [Arsukibacterium sp. MJ3]KKO47523.1 hypothetical protein VT06_16640 [Arsukibacterium sp. MJ3]
MSSNIDSDFYTLVREALHKKWDPIGVCAYSEEMGEYDGYLPNLCRILKEDGSEDQVFNFLWTAETDSMGLSGDVQATREFSRWLVSLKR